MAIKVGINGFGRIGRSVFRQSLENNDIEIVGINDLTDPKTLAHLLKYDSTHGVLSAEVTSDDNALYVNSKKINLFSEPNPSAIAWGDLELDVIIECTGRFTKKEDAALHLNSGVKKVIISAPSPDAKTIVVGVNDDTLSGTDDVVSNASCTTNCLAPIAKIIDDHFTITKGYITTTHAFTADQRLQDSPHKDLRRARSATDAIIPTKTGAATAVGKVLPNLNGKLDGIALRVPVGCGSIVDFVCEVEQTVSAEQVNQAIHDSIKADKLEGIVAVTDAPIVSKDIIGSKESAIVDSGLTSAKDNMVKLLIWYDNETAYSKRLIDLVGIVLKSKPIYA